MESESFWAITCYFNPCSYQRRLINYKIFRKFLNVPLVAVELSFDGTFDLAKDDAEILIQIKGNENNLMWQKERLLNIALDHLPAECDKFAWLDCDIIFTNNNWAEDTVKLLQKFRLIQPFHNRYDCHQEFTDILLKDSLIKTDKHLFFSNRPSLASLADSVDEKEVFRRIACGQQSIVFEDIIWTSGLAWASHKEIFLETGFYDRCIVGSGDLAMIIAGYNQAQNFVKKEIMSSIMLYKNYLNWATKFVSFIGESIYYTKENVFHLWHGDINNRQYAERHLILKEWDFDPYTDITLDDNGCWRWNSNKPELHQYIKDYFYSRKEDA